MSLYMILGAGASNGSLVCINANEISIFSANIRAVPSGSADMKPSSGKGVSNIIRAVLPGSFYDLSAITP